MSGTSQRLQEVEAELTKLRAICTDSNEMHLRVREEISHAMGPDVSLDRIADAANRVMSMIEELAKTQP